MKNSPRRIGPEEPNSEDLIRDDLFVDFDFPHRERRSEDRLSIARYVLKPRQSWPIAALVLIIASLTACESVVPYRTTKGGGTEICEDIQQALINVAPPRPASPGICRWHAQLDTLSSSSVQSPQWHSFDPSEEMVRDMWLVRYSYFQGADEERLDEIWKSKFQSQWRHARKNGKYRYEKSLFDIDNDGEKESVIREVNIGCSDDLLWPATPRMFVVGNQRIDHRYGASGTNVSSAIVVRDKTIIAVVEEVPNPDRRNVADPRSQLRLSVNFSWPKAPSQNAPFMLDQPICSFEPKR